jgi:hypothetical protein
MAMSISRQLTAVDLPNRIGVTSGEAFCGRACLSDIARSVIQRTLNGIYIIE